MIPRCSVGVLFALLAVVTSVHAQQSTRANEIAADQAAKATTLAPEGPARWEELVGRIPLGAAPEGADVVDLAAWTVVGNVLLNLDETLMKR